VRIARSCGVAGAAVSLLTLVAGCGSAGGTSTQDHGVTVVASTNVYGDIVTAIGGAGVAVTSIITDPSADPHSYEASARTQLAVSQADLVIENGGGYDDFMGTLLKSSDSRPKVINAVDVSGKQAEAKAAGKELNEHVWYDLPTVQKVADRIVSDLSVIDPAHAGTYKSNGEHFTEHVQQLQAQEESAKPTTQGAGVAITEPVPGYLLDALGAVNRTPTEFSKAIEEGSDVPATVMQETLGLFTGGQVKALVYNEQTAGPETQHVLQAAKDAGVAVVPVTETLPAGQDYLSWMRSNIQSVAAALAA
jgi:zinc/manganese transport system substrate-binding protein